MRLPRVDEVQECQLPESLPQFVDQALLCEPV